MDPDDMSPDQLLMTLSRRIRSARLAALEPLGLALHQAKALSIVARHAVTGDFRPSDLARRLDITPRSATEVVDALQEKGLVARTPSPTDRRAQVLSLTTAGREVFERMRTLPEPDGPGVFALLSAGELAALTALLRKAVGGP
jgi:DNA-binding MarR family transcriptional regulator